MEPGSLAANTSLLSPWEMLRGCALWTPVAAAMAAADAGNGDAYRANAASFIAKLHALHASAADRFGSLPEGGRTVVTAHDAFGYLADSYGLNFLAPVGIDTEAEPSASELAALIDHLKETGAGALFVENITSPALIEPVSYTH